MVEVANISSHGIWLHLGGRELFLSFADFPWLRRATVDQILAVTLPGPGLLYWPDLDIDLAVESILEPSAFAKAERDDLTATQKAALRRVIDTEYP